MKQHLTALLLGCALPLVAWSQSPSTPSTAPEWSAADYARFTHESFRQHGSAQRVLERGSIDYALLNAALFYATNAERVKHKLPPFQFSAALTASAFEHSRDMALQDFFSHENPKDAAKRTPWQRMAAHGVAGGTRAENIAMRTVSNLTYLTYVDMTLKQWMDSSGHRKNILNPKLTAMGCGAHACRCPKFHLYATQNFGG